MTSNPGPATPPWAPPARALATPRYAALIRRARPLPPRGRPRYIHGGRQGYEALKNAIIRPHRHEYDASELGPTAFQFGGVWYKRTDVTVKNARGLRLQGSHWEPVDDFANSRTSSSSWATTSAASVSRGGGAGGAAGRPTVVFLHGNSSSRVEAKTVLACCLAVGASVFSFDFAGSGRSDGDYVSLGHHEHADVAAVVHHLRVARGCERIVLWGRSMGAATALLYGAALKDPTSPLSSGEAAADGAALAGMVLDSPFSDFTTLADEQVDRARQSGVMAPGFVVSLLLSYLADAIKETVGFDPRSLSPIDGAERATAPALFIVARDDKFIAPAHGRRIHEKYGADKGLLLVRGSHNTPRPAGLYDATVGFLRHCLRVPTYLVQVRMIAYAYLYSLPRPLSIT